MDAITKYTYRPVNLSILLPEYMSQHHHIANQMNTYLTHLDCQLQTAMQAHPLAKLSASTNIAQPMAPGPQQ